MVRKIAVRSIPLVLIGMLLTVNAQATDPSASRAERAVRIGHSALELYSQGEWASAFHMFRAANKLATSPVFLLYMARCKHNERDLIAAKQLYDEVAQMNLSSDAPEPWRTAVAEGRQEYRELLPQIPSLRISYRGERPMDPVLLVDGAPAQVTGDSPVLELNPGHHVLECRSGERSRSREVILKEGQQQIEIEFFFGQERSQLAASPPASPPQRKAVTPEPLTARISPKPETTNAPAITSFAVGGVGLLLGITTGVLAIMESNDIKAACNKTQCPTEQEQRGSSALALAHISTAGFAVAVAGTGVGVSLLLTQTPSDEPFRAENIAANGAMFEVTQAF